MVDINVSDAFSAGIGLALGLAMPQHMFRFMKPQERITRQVIVCLRCRGKNPVENKFCGQCGKPLYPPPQVQCPKCHAAMSSSMNYCGSCGSKLKE